MDNFGDGANVIIAGASGLVGGELLNQLLLHPSVRTVYALVRSPLDNNHTKLKQIQDAKLRVNRWDDSQPFPELGFICLGTTLKQAGSKQALAQVDFELVCQVAQTMKRLGVKRIGVVSSYGAKADSFSHYLRCKGKVEQEILGMGFDRVVFVRPGPLAGKRVRPRKDEVIIGKILSLIDPLLIGPLTNFKPIQARQVACALLHALFNSERDSSNRYIALNSSQMRSISSGIHIT